MSMVSIEQGYLDSFSGEFLLRCSGSEYSMAARRQINDQEDRWFSDKVPIWVFGILWRTVAVKIRKHRTLITQINYVMHIDEYLGELSPLMIIDIEFETQEDSEAFKLPKWMSDVREVTGDERYGNRQLAIDGLPKQD
ncbi:MAG: hypothetical protein Q8P30_04710 [Candidatus Uhrbacteria bacterium]|nr:hypothetical protein [Candidatus Uhrbacteria bacterium]